MKKAKTVVQAQKPGEINDILSKNSKKIIGAGILILAMGFWLLTKTDPKGQNLASVVSPFLIIGGYIAIAVGIIIP